MANITSIICLLDWDIKKLSYRFFSQLRINLLLLIFQSENIFINWHSISQSPAHQPARQTGYTQQTQTFLPSDSKVKHRTQSFQQFIYSCCTSAWVHLAQQVSVNAPGRLPVNRCYKLPHAPCFKLHALVDTDARRYGNIVHLQISTEMYLNRPSTTTTDPIKPNYTILLFLSNNKEGCWGWVRGRHLM